MDLQTIWFVLITILFSGFFVLEGFDYGVGILLPFAGKTDAERRLIINTIGPLWDGNEVWLITAGGAMFAAFPSWYATLFSGYYLALFLILLALIIRGVAFEFRSKDDRPGWRQFWDWAIFIGSSVPAFLWGVAVADFIRGVPIGAGMQYIGTFFDLLSPYALMGGFLTLSVFILHGGLFLNLKTDGVVHDRVEQVTRSAWVPVLVLVIAFAALSATQTDLYATFSWVKVAALAMTLIALLLVAVLIRRKRFGLAFTGTAIMLVSITVLVFASMYPRVMPSSLGAEYDLTIYNASSSPYTLHVMTIIALTLVPVVIAYQGWSYWIFRKRLTTQSHLEY